MPRKNLPGFGVKGRMGRRGAQVRAFLEDGRVRVQWSESGRRLTESWPDTVPNRKVAAEYAEGVAERLAQAEAGRPAASPYATRSLRALWDAYQTAEFEHLRPTTRRNYGERWGKFETFLGRQTAADRVTRETLDRFRRALREAEHQVTQVKAIVAMVLRVYRWAVDRDLLPPSKVTTYRFKTPRDEKPQQVAAYTPDEVGRIVGVLDPRDPTGWRTYVATVLFAFAGPRQNAARHLEWRDVDLAGKRVHWRSELDKLGESRWQPVPQPVIDALWVAYGWRTAFGYQGPFVLFRPALGLRAYDARRRRWHASTRRASRASSIADQPWTYGAYNRALRKAETAAKVEHKPYRASHGFRRHVVTLLYEQTGDLLLAGAYVGDKDLRVLRKSYLRERDEHLRKMADAMEPGSVRASEPPPAREATA